MQNQGWSPDWSVGVRLWVDRQGQTVLGEGRAELLSAIDQLHSITAAAKAVGMSYRKAWAIVQEVNGAAGEPFVESAVGGVTGGGARLTERGKFALATYEQLRAALQSTAVGLLQQTVRAETSCVHLAAAISLQEAIGQLLTEYALRQPTVRVRAIFGASNELADHLLAGAPGDLFISADAAHLDRLGDRLDPHSRRVVAINRLAIIGTGSIKKPADLLQSKRIALAEPACPLGRYSKAYLESIGLYESLLPKIVHVDNSRAVLSAVESGSTDVGIAFSSDAGKSERCETLLGLNASAEYTAAIIQGPQQTAATAVLNFFATDVAARCFRRCGLKPA